MEKNIQIAFVISRKHNITSLVNTLVSKGNIVDIFEDLTSLVNTTFYDVILVHEAFLQSFKREQFSNSAVIVISDNATRISELFPKVTNKQIHTIISLPINESMVINHIYEATKALISDKTIKASVSEEGKSVIVSSFSNGSGKSLISYNLAAKLAQFFPDNTVCLVDMNQPLSISKAMLNIEDTYSWQTLQPLLQEGTVDKQKIANIVYLTKYRYSLLSGPTSLQKNQQLTLKEFKNLNNSLKKIFKVVIYDFHTVDSEVALQYISYVDMPLMTIDLTAISMLQTVRGISMVRENNSDLSNTMRYIVNRVDNSLGKSSDLVASRLEIVPFAEVDNDPEAVNTYIQNGLLFEDKTLLLDKQLFTLAESIVRELF